MSTHPLPRATGRARLAIVATCIGATAASGCLRNPSADAATAEALTEIGHQLAAIQQDNAVLQSQVDSLRAVVARQDTVLRRLANMAGVPMAP